MCARKNKYNTGHTTAYIIRCIQLLVQNLKKNLFMKLYAESNVFVFSSCFREV